jgi:hypothetical protein
MLSSAVENNPTVATPNYVYTYADYSSGNPIQFNPYSYKISAGMTAGLIFTSVEYKTTISYFEKGRGIEIRAFAGSNFKTETNPPVYSSGFDTRLNMGGQTGRDDYLFDEVFLGRSEFDGLLSQQFTATQGGFKVNPYAIGQSETWLAAVNLNFAFPFHCPIHFFADIGAYDIPKDFPDEVKKLPMYDIGFEVRIIPNVFSVYLPIGYSKDIDYIYNLPFNKDHFDTYGKKIRFELNLSKLNPFTLRDNIRF